MTLKSHPAHLRTIIICSLRWLNIEINLEFDNKSLENRNGLHSPSHILNTIKMIATDLGRICHLLVQHTKQLGCARRKPIKFAHLQAKSLFHLVRVCGASHQSTNAMFITIGKWIRWKEFKEISERRKNNKNQQQQQQRAK